MTETTGGSDVSLGMSMVFGIVAVLAAIATASAAYLSTIGANGETMQLYSGFFIAVALIAGGLAVAALHVFN